MGYGMNLKRILDCEHMKVTELARKTKIPASTIYAIIQRDSPVRYDYALKIASVMHIPVRQICRDCPEKGADDIQDLLSQNTIEVLKRSSTDKRKMIEDAVECFYLMDDRARRDILCLGRELKSMHEAN